MKLFTCIILISIQSFLFAQNNLIIFTESTEPIQIEYNEKVYPARAQTDVEINNIKEHAVKVKIIFAQKNIPSIDTLLFLYHPTKSISYQDVIYYVTRDNKNIKYLATLPSSDLMPVIPEVDTSIQVKSREEKGIQKIIFFNDSNSVCLNAIDTMDFRRALSYIDKTPNQDRKIVLIEQLIKHNCLNATQSQMLIERVPFEVERLKIMKLIIYKNTDVFDLWKWKEYLKYPIAQQSFIEYYDSYLNNLKNKPLLDDSTLKALLSQWEKIKEDVFIQKQIRIVLSHYSVQLSHIELMIKYLHHDQDKEDVLKCAYYSLRDKTAFEKAIQLLQFKESQIRLKQYYEQQKK